MAASMNQPVEVSLRTDLLGVISQMLPEDKTAVSPFSVAPPRYPTPSEAQDLQTDGILGANGHIASHVQRTLATLAKSRSFARLRVNAGSHSLEYSIYFASDGGSSVSVMPVGDRLQINDPAPVADIRAWLSQMIGASAIKAAEFEAELTPRDAHLLGIVVDAHRRQLLLEIASGEPAELKPLTTKALKAALTAGTTGYGVATAIAEVSQAETVSSANLETSLAALVAAGHLTQDGAKYSPALPVRNLSAGLLLITTIVNVLAGQQDEAGERTAASLTVLQGGVHDLLAIERSADLLRIESVSAAKVLAYVDVLMEEPAAAAAT